MNAYRVELEPLLREIFEKARATDEAEFYAALLKHANLSPWDSKDTLKNIEGLMSFIYGGLVGKTIPAEESLRLMLLLYCHFFEWTEVYNLFYDLAGITEGKRAGSSIEEPDVNREKYWKDLKNIVAKDLTPERARQTFSLAAKVGGGSLSINKKINIISKGNQRLGTALSKLFDSTLRNGFSHNNYTFTTTGLTVTDEVAKKTASYSFDEVNMVVNQTKTLVALLVFIWREYLSNLRSAHLKGKYCEYGVQYRDDRFRINFIKGSLPLGPTRSEVKKDA